ncbi:MAG TPA: SRPBCC domain-containing protein [Candidatus Magasanikbacteria bacterium]|nr:SRPBCC domain-containing protein [Candidatus Magasanikbacteria bacterium]
MKKLHFEIFIAAAPEKVWNTMIQDATYRQWTLAFNELGGWYEGDWNQGSEIKFLGPNPADPSKVGGMLSRVAENRPYEFISLEHYGMIMDGVEDTTSDEVKKWTPAFENYTFVEKDGGTQVIIDIDTNEEYADMFAEMWPKALEKVKELAEK